MKSVYTLEEFSKIIKESRFHTIAFCTEDQPDYDCTNYINGTAVFTSIIIDEFLCGIWLTSADGSSLRFDEVVSVEEVIFFQDNCTKFCINCGVYCSKRQVKKYILSFYE